MTLLEIILLLLCISIVAPFVIFFCGKWGAFGWFGGKYLAERRFRKSKNVNSME